MNYEMLNWSLVQLGPSRIVISQQSHYPPSFGLELSEALMTRSQFEIACSIFLSWQLAYSTQE